jgi:membrane peptidoglycan carboxypeptidase
MGQELMGLQQLSAQEESRLRDIGVQLDLEEVAGAQLAAANAQELSAQATQQGMQGLTSLGSQLAEQAPLFEQNALARQNLKQAGGKVQTTINPAIQQGKQKLTQDISAGVDKFKQDRANVFLKDFTGINFLNPFRP